MGTHAVIVGPLPAWLDRARLLGPGPWTRDGAAALATLDTAAAADLAARLRGMGLDGMPIEVSIVPPLHRNAVRNARTEDARRRRDTTPGFTRTGTRTDEEGRWSLTPELLAARLGQEAAKVIGPAGRVLDAGCGIGGNTIGFARAGLTVTAVDRDAERLAMARHNARLYGVADKITFRATDAAVALADGTYDLVFLDPPWGTEWSRTSTRLADLGDFATTLALARAACGRVWVKLPPSFATADLGEADIRAVFGEAAGDRSRIKYLLARLHRA